MSATASTSTVATTVKLTVALPKPAIDAITELAQEQGKTKTQVLREAIALKLYVERELACSVLACSSSVATRPGRSCLRIPFDRRPGC